MWHKLRYFSLKPLVASQKWRLIPCLICVWDSRVCWSRHMSLIFLAWQWNEPFITHCNTCCTFKKVKPLGICPSMWRAHWFVMAGDRLCHIIFVNSTHCKPLNKYAAPSFFFLPTKVMDYCWVNLKCTMLRNCVIYRYDEIWRQRLTS